MPNINPPVPLGTSSLVGDKVTVTCFSGHALGAPKVILEHRAALRCRTLIIPQLASIVNSGTTATVTLKSPTGSS